VLVSDFDFDLPADLVAQHHHARGTSRLLVVDRTRGTWQDATIGDLPSLLAAGDLLVANDTRVFPARLLGRRWPGGGAGECMLLERLSDTDWVALVHPGQRLKPGSRLVFDDPVRAPRVRLSAEVLAQQFFGKRHVRLSVEGLPTVDLAIDALGHVPLPPYIRRADDRQDREQYQTVYATARGSVAAPTAGLHFDRALLEALAAAGIGWETVTLHVGYGTFKPVRTERVEDHVVDPERFSVPSRTAAAIKTAHASKRRVVAVGTTTTRALEQAAAINADLATRGRAEIFIAPGHEFRVVDAMVTNFHLPRSSLLMLVAAFAGRDLTLAAYRHAVAARYRFYSYGDAMLIT
jgi:S-adenosylmethionine:tRNA ribosyltransferase-isomerase